MLHCGTFPVCPEQALLSQPGCSFPDFLLQLPLVLASREGVWGLSHRTLEDLTHPAAQLPTEVSLTEF